MSDRIKPLVDVSPVWERETSTYPDTVRILMDDGKAVTYRMEVALPHFHPAHQRAMDIIRKMPVYGGDPDDGFKGYQYEPKHEKLTIWDKIKRLKEKEGKKNG